MRAVVGWICREAHLILRIPLLFVGRAHRATGVVRGLLPVQISCSCGRVFYESEVWR